VLEKVAMRAYERYLAQLERREAREQRNKGDIGNDNDPDGCKGSKKKSPACTGGTPLPGPGKPSGGTDMGGDGVRKPPTDPIEPIRRLPITCSSVPVHIIYTGDPRLRHIAIQRRNPPIGAFPPHPSGDDTMTVIPSQWGGKGGLWPYLDDVEGNVEGPYRRRPRYRGIGDVVGGAESKLLPGRHPGRVIIERPVVQRPTEYGDQTMTFVVPLGLGCPVPQ
jgi:hypothetical protein